MPRTSERDPWPAKIVRRSPRVVGQQLHFYSELQRPGTEHHERMIESALPLSRAAWLMKALIKELVLHAEEDSDLAKALGDVDRVLNRGVATDD